MQPVTGPILVATDFSTRSDRALRRATMIARQLDAALALVHVVDSDQPQYLVDQQVAASRSLLEESVRTITQMDGVAADQHVVTGDVFSGILQVADFVAARLIIVGPHRRQLRDAFIGTTAERTIAHSRRPVLMTAGFPSAPYDRALIALDLDDVSKAAAQRVLELGLVDPVQLVAMHAYDAPGRGMMQRAMIDPDAIDHYVAGEQERAQADFDALLADAGLSAARRLLVPINGAAAHTILECAREAEASLIIVGTSQRTGLQRFMLGSVAEDVLGETDRDVLVVPRP